MVWPLFVGLLVVYSALPIHGSPCDHYRPYVGHVPVCTPSVNDSVLAPNPKETPFGGIDVTNAACQYDLTPTCCGTHPRWNWILGGCDPNMAPVPPSSPFSCKADVKGQSQYDLYYIAAYQWNYKTNKWTLDTTSSVLSDGNGGTINNSPQFQKVKVSGSNSPYPPGGDWQDKWAPRTASTGTMGLGPPGFMFVLSAKSLGWMTFYSLTQKTINRGTENQFSPSGFSNCWYAELDFLEAPFWSDGQGKRGCMLSNYPDASFFSSGAQFGGCFPMGTNMGPNFAQECSTQWCCEGTRCPANFKGFINPSQYGSSIAGCVPNSQQNPPAGTVFVGPTKDPSMCTRLSVLGGCGSSSFFENAANTEYMFAFVVDQKGIYSYRWNSADRSRAEQIWPGLGKFSPAQTLQGARPAIRPTTASTPCFAKDDYCVIFHPGSPGERACVSAGGDPKFLDYMAVAAAGGSNWWNWMNDTGQWWSYDDSVLATDFTQ